MSDFLFVVAPHWAEIQAQVHSDRSGARRAVEELGARSLAYRVVVIDSGSRRWWQAEGSDLTDRGEEHWQSLPQGTETGHPLFVFVPHVAGPRAAVDANLEETAMRACYVKEGCRVVAINPDANDPLKWKERLFAGPEHGTRLEDLRPAIVEGLRGLVDELATDR